MLSENGTVYHEPHGATARRLVSAATNPVNIVVAALFLATGFFWTPAALAVLLIYPVMVFATMKDLGHKATPGLRSVREALKSLPPGLRTRVLNVITVCDTVRSDLDQMSAEPDGVREGLNQLIATLMETADRAADVDRFLGRVERNTLEIQTRAAEQRAGSDPAKISIAEAMREQADVYDRLLETRRNLDTQMEHIAASLGAIQARVMQALVARDAPVHVTEELLELRDTTRALAQGFDEVNSISTQIASPEPLLRGE